nr:MAG TPA: hypothetical protein [Caudoviricetes sp.]DAT26119.1 MAG TPA: hypothetical protein [Caudoviricetes sp.]
MCYTCFAFLSKKRNGIAESSLRIARKAISQSVGERLASVPVAPPPIKN